MHKRTIIQKINAYERLMRLDKPIGILLLLWPTLWGLLLAGKGFPSGQIVLIFVTGVVLMRSAGCVMNDIADRKFDGSVERTKSRPIVSGEVSVKEAIILAMCLSLTAFVLVCFLNQKTILLSFIALFLAASYPFTKRFLAIPQAYLGIAFGFAIPMAYAAVTNQIPMQAWLLMLANVFWSIAYDTEYAMVDREDDLKIGIKSSAIFFGRFDVIAVMVCYMLMLGIFVAIGYQMQFGACYYTGVLISSALVLSQYLMIRNRDKTKCFKAFLANNWIGLVLFVALLIAVYLP